MGGVVPERVYALFAPSRRRLEETVAYLRSRGDLSSGVLGLVEGLAALAPAERLGSNMGIVLSLLELGEVENVLQGGVTDEERRVLLEVQLGGVPSGYVEVIHGLLNIHERWVLKRALSKPFRDARGVSDRCWSAPKVLDGILGGTDEKGEQGEQG
jgi:hypothetical protein